MREFGSEHPAVILPDNYFNSFEKFVREIVYLRTGREALLYASCNCKKKTGGVILCPAYSCWSMIAPFELTGWSVVYYRLNDDLTIDLDYLKHLIDSFKPDAILTMNYYGSTPTDEAVTCIKESDERIVVIEDFSHCTFSLSHIFNEKVDYYVSSIRKSIGVCDGAIILSKKTTNKEYIGIESPAFGELRYCAQIHKGQYFYTKDISTKRQFLIHLRQGEEMINSLDGVHPMSKVSKAMIEIINGKEMAFARRENMRHMHSLLKGKVRTVPGLERSFKGAPFSLPILVDDRDDVQKRMAQHGVYAPVLWPIRKEAKTVCTNSTYVAEHMLSIPIDQRYNYDDIEDIAKIVIKSL